MLSGGGARGLAHVGVLKVLEELQIPIDVITGQLTGNHALLLRLGWYRRLSESASEIRGFFVGATLETGNAWVQRSDVSLTHPRTGTSLFLDADTGIGPLYLGLPYASQQAKLGLALFLGRP